MWLQALFCYHYVDWLDRFNLNQNNIWFVVRYSNGAYKAEELEPWSINKLTTAARRLKYWFDMEEKNRARSGLG